MTSKYTAILEKTREEQRRLAIASTILPKEEKAKGSRFDRAKRQINALLREILEVQRELAS